MLAKTPAERPQSMSELVGALEQCLAATKASLAPYAPTVSFFAENVADSSGTSATLPPTEATVPVPPIPTTVSRTPPNLATLRWMLAFMMLGLVAAILVGILFEWRQSRIASMERRDKNEAAAEETPKQPAQESLPQTTVGAFSAVPVTSPPSGPSAVKPALVQHGLRPDPGREKPAAPTTPTVTEAAATIPRTSPGFDKTGLPKEDSPKTDSSAGGMAANKNPVDGADSGNLQNPPQDSEHGAQQGQEYRVTVISEPARLEEVIARLGQERVIWVRLNKSQVSRGHIEQLREWVREGGVLWTDTGFASAEAMEPEFGFSMMPNPNNSRTGSCRPTSGKRTHPILKDLPYDMNYTLAEDRFLIRVVPGERGKEPVHIRLLLETSAEKRKLRTGVCGICYFGRGKMIYRPAEVTPTTAGEQFERNLREYSASLAQKAGFDRTPAKSDDEKDDADLQ